MQYLLTNVRAWFTKTKSRKGGLLIEALMAISLFGLYAVAAFLLLITGQESSQTGASRVKGVLYAEQALEVAKIIGRTNFDNLTTGTHGYALTLDGEWVLSGSSITRYGYSTWLGVQPIDDNTKLVIARSAWKRGYQRSGTTVISMTLSNWRTTSTPMGDWSALTQTGVVNLTGSTMLNDVIVNGDYAYISSQLVGSGKGLMIYDISDPTSPTQVSTSFTLSGEAGKMAVKDNSLFAIVADGSDEVQVFDISDPTILTSGSSAVTGYNLPGGLNRGRSLYRKGNNLYVGASGDASESEFYSFSISSTGVLTLLDSLDLTDNPAVYDVYVADNYAYLATDRDVQEMMVVNISDPSNLVLWTAYNATDVHDGYAVRQAGTGYYLGRQAGGSIDEYALITGSGGIPSVSPSKTYGVDIGDSVNAMDLDLSGCYAFMATSFNNKELQIRSAKDKTVPEIAYINMPNDAQGVFYEGVNDLLYVTTNTGMAIFAPGSGTGSCI